VKIKVLYEDGGRIVSLSRVPEPDPGDGIAPAPRSGVEPSEGQHVAIVSLDPALHDRRLSDIHQRFILVHEGHGVRLQQRAEPKAT
jgi:hypothetical protein